MDTPPLLYPLSDDDRPVVERLWQLYSHDMSEFRGTLPGSDGMYKPGACRRISTTPTGAGT